MQLILAGVLFFVPMPVISVFRIVDRSVAELGRGPCFGRSKPAYKALVYKAPHSPSRPNSSNGPFLIQSFDHFKLEKAPFVGKRLGYGSLSSRCCSCIQRLASALHQCTHSAHITHNTVHILYITKPKMVKYIVSRWYLRGCLSRVTRSHAVAGLSSQLKVCHNSEISTWQEQ